MVGQATALVASVEIPTDTVVSRGDNGVVAFEAPLAGRAAWARSGLLSLEVGLGTFDAAGKGGCIVADGGTAVEHGEDAVALLNPSGDLWFALQLVVGHHHLATQKNQNRTIEKN